MKITDLVYDVAPLAPIGATILAEIVRKAGKWITRKPKPFASNNPLKTIDLTGFSLILS